MTPSRTIIAALQVSLDGFTQGAEGEKDWAGSWADALELLPDVDAFVLGAGMYPGYGEYWSAVRANPGSVPPFQDRLPSESEVAYARMAANTPHIVVSRTLDSVPWPPMADVIDTIEPLRRLKRQPGKAVYVVGGATLVSSLLNEGLIDELRLIVHPVILGQGQPLFGGVNERLSLDLVEATPTKAGRVIMTYRTTQKADAAYEAMAILA